MSLLGFVPWTTDTWDAWKKLKDPLNLFFVRELGAFPDAVAAVRNLLGFGYTRLAGDQWFELVTPTGSLTHRHDASLGTERSLTDWGSRLHVRLFAGIRQPGVGLVTAGAVHLDAPTLACWPIDEVAESFDMPRETVADRFRQAGVAVAVQDGLPRSVVQCDGIATPTDGKFVIIG